jgi:hypothetical protein
VSTDSEVAPKSALPSAEYRVLDDPVHGVASSLDEMVHGVGGIFDGLDEQEPGRG